MKRQKYAREFKLQVVKEALETGNTTLVSRRYELSRNMVQRWVRESRNGKFDDIHTDDFSLDTKELAQENDQLKRLLGEKDLEIAILRDLIKKKNPQLLKKLK
ncbi:transposase [Marinicrinis sediminis]|uniref:Transposase n=1 Tax=Marinicrinis sediminis TaxID=1652465 RepID=A0ABW5RC75_9BACL